MPVCATSCAKASEVKKASAGKAELKGLILIIKPTWRNWQTRTTQNRMNENSCGFDSRRRHLLIFMTEDKVLKQIHNNQSKLREKGKGLSWDDEAEMIDQEAQKVAREYNYPVFPVAKTRYVLRDKGKRKYGVKKKK